MIKLILTVAGKMMKSTIQDQISYATVCYKNIEITVQKKLKMKNGIQYFFILFNFFFINKNRILYLSNTSLSCCCDLLYCSPLLFEF